MQKKVAIAPVKQAAKQALPAACGRSSLPQVSDEPWACHLLQHGSCSAGRTCREASSACAPLHAQGGPNLEVVGAAWLLAGHHRRGHSGEQQELRAPARYDRHVHSLLCKLLYAAAGPWPETSCAHFRCMHAGALKASAMGTQRLASRLLRRRLCKPGGICRHRASSARRRSPLPRGRPRRLSRQRLRWGRRPPRTAKRRSVEQPLCRPLWHAEDGQLPRRWQSLRPRAAPAHLCERRCPRPVHRCIQSRSVLALYASALLFIVFHTLPV